MVGFMCSVVGCDRPVVARGWCRRHYDRWRRLGDAEGGGPLQRQPFWDRVWVAGPDDCWEWLMGRSSSGYGVLTIDYKKWTASRYAWTLENGPVPAGQMVLHRCDNRLCVNPAHLYLGNHQQNMQDMAERHRNWSKARLTPDDVRAIRQLREEGWGYREIGEKYGIDRSHAKDIVHRRRWGWVE